MSGVTQVTKTGPRTYVPASGVAVTGGQLVEGRAGGRIGPAAAASVKVLGVALADAIAPEDVVTTPTTVNGRPVLNTALLPTNVAVAYGNVEAKVAYSANANFGDLLVATANGTVAPAGATPDARTIVGRCTEPAGVVFATNPVGLARIH
ncbi:scaffolding protein [Rhodococcus phage Mbo4]|uniref:Scaffolding protein n=2 Tax=root TaxID=1 RepID=A0A9E7IFS4_9CAUD|nr:hypothetical protein [Rhodococcus opacus]YP_010755910.1 scaffolding protein [Rhodococcus phage Mbo4]EKT83048.1 hypothetical protein WSS_A09032 [Rhodococcus opacus M213]URG17495.1 scaffolding protein [Rhodococcus phage Mbo4]